VVVALTIVCEHCGRSVTRPKGDEGRGRFCSISCGAKAQPRPTREERFWNKVAKSDGCWEWTGTHRSGSYRYGVLKGRKAELAHRVSWEINVGPIPPGLDVLHHCDNPPCVRPDHLFVGTQGDNNRDRDRKGRQRSPRKLTIYTVREIRRRRGNGEKLRVLAEDYGITTGHVSNIYRRIWWRDLG